MSKLNQIKIFIQDGDNVYVLAPKEKLVKSYASIPVHLKLLKYGDICNENFPDDIPQEVLFNQHLRSKEIVDNYVVLDWKQQPHVFEDHIVVSLN